VKKIITIIFMFVLVPLSLNAGLFTSIEQDLMNKLESEYVTEREIEKLLKKGADPNYHEKESTYTPLLFICLNDKIDIDLQISIVKLLLDNGADINLHIDSGSTPLMVSTYRPELVKYLLSQGANPDIKTTYGETALDKAFKYEHYESAKFIQKNFSSYSAETIFKDFSDNELLAKKKYMNQYLDITGSISDIKKDSLTYYVYMTNGKILFKIRFHEDDLLKVKKGQNVKFRGAIYYVKEEIGIIMINFHYAKLIE
jgi:hypothetical protein